MTIIAFFFLLRLGEYTLLAAYKYPVPILNAFGRDYRTGNISSNSRAVPPGMVENDVWSIGQAIAALGAKEPQMTSTRKIDGRLQLQFR